MKLNTRLLILAIFFIASFSQAQTNYYGLTNKGGNSDAGVIFKTDASGANIQTVFNFDYHNAGRNPNSVFTQASNGKIYGTTQFGGTNLCTFPWYQYQKYSGVIFEYDPITSDYNVLFNFNDTNTGCWPNSAPVLASNGKLYGVTPGIGGFSQHYGTVYSYDLNTNVYTKIHSFGKSSSDGENPIGNLLLAADGKLYGLTSSGGYNDKGIIFTIDPATDTYLIKMDLRNGYSGNKAAQNPKAGLIQASNGIMYGTSSRGGNYPVGYSYAYGNIFKYNPTTNVATNLYGFSDVSLGSEPEGAPVMVGTNDLYCITHKYYPIAGSYYQQAHYYLWKYTISTGTAIVVDSIANGRFNNDIVVNTSGEIILTGEDNNISNATRFWKFDPTTNTRTLLDTSVTVNSFSRGLMLSSNGKYYAGGSYQTSPLLSNNGNSSFIEYDATAHTVVEKFKFSDPVDGVSPEGDLFMATNGRMYGTTSKGGMYNKGVVFEFNPSNDTYIKKFDLDSLTGYEPKGSLMEASNGKLYGMTTRGGTNSYGAIFEIDTNSWTLTKKADFDTDIRGPGNRLVEAWDGYLYGLSSWYYGRIFQYNITTGVMVAKHTFSTNDGTSPSGSLAIANNGKLYGFTVSEGASYYSKGTLFEYAPATSIFTMKKELYNYTGYRAKGNTPLLGSDGIMYLLIANGGSGNTQYEGGAIDEYIPGATLVTNKATFSVTNTGSNPFGSLMESANGKFYGYTWTGGANLKGTLFEYDKGTATITKKVDFDGTNGANPTHGSLTEVGSSAISITQQPAISSSCVGDVALLTVIANHTTLLHYQWYKNGNRIAGATNDTLIFNTLLATDDGTYYCKITGGAKAAISNNITVSSAVRPTVSIGNIASTYCLNNDDINLTATPSGGSYSGTGVSGSVFSPANAGTGNIDIVYSYTSTAGCSNSDTASVTVNALPDASFTGYNTSYCDNSTASTLIPTTTGGTFTGAAVTGNTFDPTHYSGGVGLAIFSKIKYAITDANSCYNADSVTVSVYHAPNVNINGLDSIYCENAQFDTIITTPAGGTLTAGAFVTANIFSPSNATLGYNYIYYSYTNSNNCTNSDTIKIKINGAPDASYTGLSATYCNNDLATTLVPVETGGIFTGTTSAMTFDPNQIVIPTGALSVSKSIKYVVTNSDGCTDSSINSAMIYALPDVDFGTFASSFCNNAAVEALNLGTPAGGTYSGNGVIASIFSPADAPIGNNDLVYSFTNSNNCTNTDMVVVEVLEAPDFTLGNDTSICINHNITLATKQGSGYIYLWSDGSTDSTLAIDASVIGEGTHTYSVTVTDENNNCLETDEVIITVDLCTGIENANKENANISVFPNPSQGIFYIESEVKFDDLQIYSTDGKLILSQELNVNDSNFKIDLKDQSKGVYYLLLNNSQTTIHKQLIVK